VRIHRPIGENPRHAAGKTRMRMLLAFQWSDRDGVSD
jgi:hypothetical protein